MNLTGCFCFNNDKTEPELGVIYSLVTLSSLSYFAKPFSLVTPQKYHEGKEMCHCHFSKWPTLCAKCYISVVDSYFGDHEKVLLALTILCGPFSN